MEVRELVMVAIGVGIIALDIVIRLWLAPNRRDRWLEELLTRR